MDVLISLLVGMGIPGLVLYVAIVVAGSVGGAAIVSALAFLGGPFGMLGGVALLLLVGQISKAIADYGAEVLIISMADKYRAQGISKQEIIASVKGYPITSGLKAKITQYIQDKYPS